MGFRMSEVTLPPPSSSPSHSHTSPTPCISKIVPKGFAFLLTDRGKDKIRRQKRQEKGEQEIGETGKNADKRRKGGDR
jgi:hypothetical protein